MLILPAPILTKDFDNPFDELNTDEDIDRHNNDPFAEIGHAGIPPLMGKPATGKTIRPCKVIDWAKQRSDFATYGDPERSGGLVANAKPVNNNPRAKAEAEKRGWLVWKCEVTHVQFERVWTTDLCGFMDFQALERGTNGVIAIQATTVKGLRPHLIKIRDIPEAREWLECGNRIVVWGWEKPEGKVRYELTEVLVTLNLLAEFDTRKRPTK